MAKIERSPSGIATSAAEYRTLALQRWVPRAAGAALLLGALAICVTRAPARGPGYLLADDAYILMRYGRNLADGYGLVWNPGEPPVEGFTSMLYVLILAGVAKVGLSQIVFAHWFGIACTAGTLLLTWRLAELVNPGHENENLLAVGLLAVTAPLIVWSAFGMDTPLFTLLVLGSALSYLRSGQGAAPAALTGSLFALTALARPEGAVLFGATVIYELARRRVESRRTFDRSLLGLVGAFVILYIPFFAWRWSYFGYPFPNTYYAKTGAGLVQWQGGLRYVAANLEALLGGTAGVLILPILLARWRGIRGAGCSYLALLLLTWWIVVAANGGDHFGGARFLTPTLPFLFVLLASGLSRLLNSLEMVPAFKPFLLAIFVAGALCRWQPWSLIQPPISVPQADPKTQEPLALWLTGFEMMGQALNRIGEPGDSIAAVPVGAIGYLSGMKVIDMVGIVDPVIAHEPFDSTYTASWLPGHDKGDGAYILSRRPTYILIIDHLSSQPIAGPNDHVLQFRSIAEIWESDEFHRNYRFYPVQVTGGWYCNLYRRIADVPETVP
jgi:hypothetical protein